MHLFDLHCDTLYRSIQEREPICKNKFHISFERAESIDKWVQCFAVFIPDELRGKAALDFFIKASHHLKNELSGSGVTPVADFNDLNALGKMSSVFTVEGGASIAGDIKNIKLLREHGVRAMTLTWNAGNEIGDGIGVENAKGLTNFGRKAIEEMEQVGIAVDVSHASEALFYDVAEMCKRPFIATHSNSKSVCSHPRNLSDDQFKCIVKAGGLVGLNFARIFLHDGGNACKTDIIRHAYHFLSLDGEDVLAMGTDFDGTDMPDGITGIESMPALYEEFLKNRLSETVVNKIFYDNAANFFNRFDKMRSVL